MLFLLQKAMAKDWLGNKVYSEQGFVHRLLITHCDYWDVPEMDRLRIPQLRESQHKLKNFHDRIYELLKKQRQFKLDSKLELELPTMTMTDDAIDKLASFDNMIKKEQTTTYSEYQGFVARLFEHTVRLAATVAIFEGSNYIEVKHADCAIELAFFYLEQRMTLDLGASTKYQNQVSIAEKLTLEIMKKIRAGTTIDKKWLSQSSPSYFRGLSKDERSKIIDEIISRGVLKSEKINGVTVMNIIEKEKHEEV
jgi:DNA replicative helicase MCM subunit Mcm2 (Cdc46/Mcm family)